MPISISDKALSNHRAKHLVVISFYEPRPVGSLENLIESLYHFEAGLPFDLVIVVNRVSIGMLRLPTFSAPVVVLERPNGGMNIGAWDYGWRKMPGYEGYLFLQDECYAKRNGWLTAFDEVASMKGVGLVGESRNIGWERSWNEMRIAQASVTMRDHFLNGRTANRVDVYLDFMRRQQVNPGEQAGHLRSLTWYAKHETLIRIDGFKHGTNYGECIAAEIAASKQVEVIGKSAIQVDLEPFCYFGHLEWQQEQPGGNWRHFSLQPERMPARHLPLGLQPAFDRLNVLIGALTAERKG